MGYFNTHRNFKMQFSIKPHSRRGGWQNILHFTANNQNYGSHGSRIPAIWFYGSSTRMHIRMGRPHHTNDGCDPGQHLALHRWTRVSVVLRGRTLSVDYDGKRVCTTHNYYHRDNGRSRVRLYMADPWYTSAHASIKDFTYGKADYGATGKCDGSVDAPTKPKRPTGKKKNNKPIVPKCRCNEEAPAFMQVETQAGTNWITSYKVKKPVKKGGSLIPHPGGVIKMAWRCDSRSYQLYPAQSFKELFSNANLYQVTKVSSITEVSEDTDVLWDILPDKAHTAAEVRFLAAFLERGGRLIMTGENSHFKKQNNIVSATVKALGGGISVNHDAHRAVIHAGHINDLQVNSGLTSIKPAYWASLKVDKSVTEVLSTSHQDKIFVADQMLKKGRVTIWADINIFQYPKDNGGFFKNLVHQGANFVAAVKKGGNPNEAGPCQC